MMIYELEDFIKMVFFLKYNFSLIKDFIFLHLKLDKTQDPISDFINAICADVVGYVAKLR